MAERTTSGGPAGLSENKPRCDVRTGTDAASLKMAIEEYLFYRQGKTPEAASLNDVYLAVSYAVRDRMLKRGLRTIHTVLNNKKAKMVSYLSAEFLMGPQLEANLIDLGISPAMREAVEELGFDLDRVIAWEQDPGLGNGGLGRLASCYMDSLATLRIPALGYGIRYEFGIFDQEIRDGWQVEISDLWLHYGNPWEIARPEESIEVGFGGYTEMYGSANGEILHRWIPSHMVQGIPYDTPEMGYRVPSCNFLRLWKSEAIKSFDFAAFNKGKYLDAVMDKVESENISKVLYPNDETDQGKKLRLKQQYFFVSCSLQDMLRLHLGHGENPVNFHERWAVQLNDTHPALAVAELMRLLLDEYLLGWDEAWKTTTLTMSYTNHTLLPEALETWSLKFFATLLPRHLEIIYEINSRLLAEVARKFPDDPERISRMSLIDDSGGKMIRMAHLACAGSHAINGVAELHTRLLREKVLHDWVEMYPEKFLNVTNGVTPRRFLLMSNPGLSSLITAAVGDQWPAHLDQLRRLEPFADDPAFREKFRAAKLENKKILASLIREKTGITTDPTSLYDVLVKRIHEYKRQHLDVLHILTLYLRLKDNPGMEMVPRTFIFGGKAAPGYYKAKLIIKLINSVAETVNSDPAIRELLKVVFFPDFNVTNAQKIYPAANLSEQISMAGKEASGTGNMKFAMNGALTIGTLDGANIEIREEAGPENFFLFGLTAEEVEETRRNGYNPRFIYENNEELRNVINLINSGLLSRGDYELFKPITDNLLGYDPFMLMADYPQYVACQEEVSTLWKNPEEWDRRAILNVARMGKFSSDRSIAEYCNKIWEVKPITY